MMRKPLLVLAVSTALTVAVFAATTSAKPISVGEFAVKVSKAMGRTASSQSEAAEDLRSLGVHLDSNLATALTEGGAVRILADLGVKASSAVPAATLSSAKATQLASIAGSTAIKASVAPAVDLPTQCLALRNRGQCDTCCTNILNPDGTLNIGSACAKFCRSVLPPGQASPSEPGE
jgi:hypothetical protein